MKYSELSDREVDALVAERLMGKRVKFVRGEPSAWQDNQPVIWSPNDFVELDEHDNPKPCMYIPGGVGALLVTHYSTDDAAARLVRNRVAELKLEHRFFQNLERIVWSDIAASKGPRSLGGFAVIHASPRQQCEAALGVVADACPEEEE